MSDSFDKFFCPATVAVVGASSKPGKIGHELFKNMSQYKFKGKVYPVNPNAKVILGKKSYPTIGKLPTRVDLAVFVAPSDTIPQLVEEAGQNGVKNAIVISGGFSEMGEGRAPNEDKLVSVLRDYGMRVIGPNCIGVFDSESHLDTFFYPHDRMSRPRAGGTSFITQSGTFGVTFLEWAANSRLGIRRLASLGNKCDVDEVDMIRYLARDPLTKVIAVHLESLSRGRELALAARTISTVKPLVVLKTGRTEQGAKAARSHTAAVSGSYEVCTSILGQSGMIVTDSFDELFNVTRAIEMQPAAQGKNIAIITNCAGPSVMAADLCAQRGLTIVPYVNAATADSLRSLPPYGVLGDYVDLTGSATSKDYENTIQIALDDPAVNVLVVFVVFLNPTLTPDIIDVIARAQNRGKAVVCYATGGDYSKKLIRRLEEYGVPTYSTAEATIAAVHALVRAGKRRTWNPPPDVDADRKTASGVFKDAFSMGREMLTEIESKSILRAYGIQTTRERVAHSISEVEMLASEIGFPVVLKILSRDITHKSTAGGIITNVRNPREALDAFDQIVAAVKNQRPDASIDGVVIENQLAAGAEVIIGSTIDRDFGPVIAFGMGGVLVELFRDLSFSLPPLDRETALETISATKAYKLISAESGKASAGLQRLQDLLVKASRLVIEQPIAEMDLNPVMISSDECTVADARIRISTGPVSLI
jgi:acyl-CoA synthetase (NDP forming)